MASLNRSRDVSSKVILYTRFQVGTVFILGRSLIAGGFFDKGFIQLGPGELLVRLHRDFVLMCVVAVLHGHLRSLAGLHTQKVFSEAFIVGPRSNQFPDRFQCRYHVRDRPVAAHRP